MEHNTKADQHFKEAEGHIKDGNHKAAWDALGHAQKAASKWAHGMSEEGKIDQAKSYRKMITGRVANLSRMMNKTEERVSKTIVEAKELVNDGKIEEALNVLKSVADSIKGGIVSCPECGEDAALMKDSTHQEGECGSCGAIWNQKNAGNHLLKYIQEGNMIDPDKKEKKLTKSDVIDALWDLHRKGDPEVQAYDINYFDYTGWLKKSLAEKLGLPMPGEAQELKKGEETEETPPAKIKEVAHYDKRGNLQVCVREWSFKSPHLMTKSDILDVLLQMVKSGEESNRINRHTVSKYEATGELDQDIEKMVYKKAGKDWFELRKDLDAHVQKSGPSLLALSKDPKKKAPKKVSDKAAIASVLRDMGQGAKQEASGKMGKESGDSDFYDDKKEHDHQLRGAKKPIIVKVKKKSLAKEDSGKKRIARWESKSGKHWVDLHSHGDGSYSYAAPKAGGVLGELPSDDHAIKEMQGRVNRGLFQPDAAKTPMKIEKEGSGDEKVIGNTKSGKPIYGTKGEKVVGSQGRAFYPAKESKKDVAESHQKQHGKHSHTYRIHHSPDDGEHYVVAKPMKIEKEGSFREVADKHQKKIARATLKMTPEGARLMGMTHEEAKRIIASKKGDAKKVAKEDLRDRQERMDSHTREEDLQHMGAGGRDEFHDEKAPTPKKAKFSNRAAPSKIGIKVKQYGNKYHGGGDPGVSGGGDE